jgi:hypothetical protein
MRFFALLSLVLVACSSPTEPINGSFEIGFGEERRAGSLSIRFADVNDSRCAPDVVCVWEGDGIVTLDVDGETVVIHTHGGPNMPQSVSVKGHRITLEALSPVAGTSKAQYRVRLKVTRETP